MGLKHEKPSETFEMEMEKKKKKNRADQNAFHVQNFSKDRLPETTSHKLVFGFNWSV